MQLPKISVITPSYNQGQYIEQTILSVVNQDYPNLEYIIIDGGSTDNTLEIIRRYEQKISYWVSEKDEGQSDAINKGLMKATGEIVVWLNSDDYYEPGALNWVGDAFVKNPEAGVVIGNVNNMTPAGSKQLYQNHFELFDFLKRVSIHQPGVFWKKELCEVYGYLDKSFYYLMDHELWVRIFFNTQIVHIEKALVNFRIHDQAKTGKNPGGLYLDFRRIISRFFNSFSDKKYRNRMEDLGIYDNPTNVKYIMNRPFSDEELEKVLKLNLMNAIVLEYTLGNRKSTNQLIFHTLKDGNMLEKLFILVKNNLGIRKYKPTA
ncbi:MAG: glycosyltransferase family 2 protein [Chitinophagales bacterium]|nr:glycosyltransferase family 2 protein [Chitinophagales bacterium]